MLLVEGSIPVQRVREEIDTDDPAEAVRIFLCRHPAARVERVAGTWVKALCVVCNAPVLANDIDYRYDIASNTYRCAVCAKEKL